MKYFLLFIFLFFVVQGYAQKYVLLDKRLAQPATFTNKVTSVEKFNGFFPVEKKELPQFIKALEEIAKKLSAKEPLGTVKQYKIGCVRFRGFTVSLASGDRLDYVINSDCDGINISMHLSDAKISNANNAFFINTWLKYIKSSTK
ncbi:MAG: hypothetical protein M3Z56_02445 [Bacteroidota bacterium]|nr:hypothetical protein [Bacteroidota bacterium]